MEKYGETLACGCKYGYERCINCRAGLHLDQKVALQMTLDAMKKEKEDGRLSSEE